MDQFAKNFTRHRDASWTCISSARLERPNGRIQVAAGTRVYPGTVFMGFDIAAWLEDRLAEQAPDCERI